MQIANNNEDQPDKDEIHGLEDTQAAFMHDSASENQDESLSPTLRIDRNELVESAANGSGELPVDEPSEPNGTSDTIHIETEPPLSGPVDGLAPESIPARGVAIGKRRSRWILVSILGLLGIATIALLAGVGGYLSGISMRENAAITQVAQAAKDQYELGVEDYVAGNYSRARQRFEYVIQIDPSYPGAVDMLANVLLELSTTATPTLLPTATVIPTPDLRGVEELYNQGDQYLASGQWTSAIDAFLQLRKTNPDFRQVEIDGKLFLALRHRGRDKILLEQDLEGGIYDLTLAQRFGIMDVEGQSLLNWSTFYLTGASFWEIDWAQAAYYFGQVAPHAPNLVDKSGITARERYRVALIRYASQLINQKQFCTAQEQLAIALTILQDPEIQVAHDQAAQACSGVPAPGEEPTQTP